MNRPIAFGIIMLVTACSLYASAQPKRPAPKPAASSSEGGAPREDAPKERERDGGKSGAAVVDQKTLDGGSKVFRFGEVEVEGRLKSPQIVYFLRRVRAEFAAGDLGHRSFIRELDDTKNEPGF